ncbi:MAG: undecaprenyl-diphosphate phosphatase, partial [Sediminibacterium sp.]|nr:undecaprenyl-diphosphate phosphatase [Sediminibacterium sp.]
MTFFQSILIAIVEGITEFLPISSTGHMIITSSLLGIAEDEFTKLFEICIQLGAILSVVVLYRNKFLPLNKFNFYLKLIIAVIPALVLGFIFSKKIDALLESPLTVAITMLVGGIILLFIDTVFHSTHPVTEEKEISYRRAFMTGVWQCLAMVPGTSRSAASIIGGMQQQMTRQLAAEFSFFLAVPTMAAATGYKLLKAWKENPELLTNTQNGIETIRKQITWSNGNKNELFNKLFDNIFSNCSSFNTGVIVSNFFEKHVNNNNHPYRFKLNWVILIAFHLYHTSN